MVGFSNTAFWKREEVSEKNDPMEQISFHLVKRMKSISEM
jgi:hypothetical protein